MHVTKLKIKPTICHHCLDKLKLGVKDMKDVKIKVEDNGPYIISGDFQMVDETGQTFKKEKEISLCRCGHSGDKPYCDGTHEDIEFASAPRANDVMVEI